MDVGRQIRKIRQSRGMSQRELAKISGVSNGTISVLEKSQSDPSVGLLRRILDGLDISIAEFFADETSEPATYFFAKEDFVNIGTGKVQYLQMGKSSKGRMLQMIKEVSAPGTSSGAAALSHPGEEAGIIISGRMEVTVGDERRILGPGDGYYFDSTLPHRFRTIGDEECCLISACTPPF
ncbi:XRE family transcriptional regulator [Kordiimonas sediminis]|uniref:XRE family transcriptional regulator n=1 Tax=Kordiimonas sediminis TaxID=1735581 RepID=A0A919AR99_9PROT|nr:cupin domain-containing protein [Kordiimonas sediminis]GHF20610.1 XRE family transcriptional regulator [Kordiimonas sediminis]